jgi:hypothetical protein
VILAEARLRAQGDLSDALVGRPQDLLDSAY